MPAKRRKKETAADVMEIDLRENSICINQLPDSLLLLIFSKLEFYELVLCSWVSKRWRSVANDFTLKKIIIMKKPLPNKFHTYFIQNYLTEHLVEFRWMKRSLLTKEELFFSSMKSMCKNLKKLDIIDSQLSEYLSINDLPSSIVHLGIYEFPNKSCYLDTRIFFDTKLNLAMPNLTCLIFSNSKIYFMREDFFKLCALKSLKALYIGGCHNVNYSAIVALKDILPQLEVLDVENSMLYYDAVQFILKHCVNIKELYIAYTRINDSVLKPKYRRYVPRLSRLCIIGNEISLNRLHEFLSECPDKSAVKVEFDEKCDSACHQQVEKLRKLRKKSSKSKSFKPPDSCRHYISHKCPELKG